METKKYEINLELKSGASLTQLLFDHSEHRWIFEYTYDERKGRKLLFRNDYKLYVDYQEGLINRVNLTMNMVYPEKLGKQFLFGVDISQGSKLFIEFEYEMLTNEEELLFQLNSMQIGATQYIDFKQDPGLFTPIDYPFPVNDKVNNEFGEFKVPFKNSNGFIDNFRFPKSIIK